jgi:ATP-dependent helicase/nuclease subunit A
MAAAGRQQLTDEQQRAICARNVSVSLSAGAGCGKTFVLTQRFLAALEPAAGKAAGSVRLDQLTAITFTERAAREMRDRIRDACSKRLLEAPEHQGEYWLRLTRELDTARISTIHSFCGSLLRAHAVEAGIDPHFSVLDQAQADTLLYELIDREIRRRLALREESVLDLVVQFGLGSLREMVRQMLDVRQEIDWPQWRAETPDGLLSRWEAYWRKDTVPRATEKIARAPATATVLEISRSNPPSHPAMRDRCMALLEQLPALGQQTTTESPAAALAAIRENAKVQGGGGKKAWASEPIYEQFRDAAAKLRSLIDDAGKRLAFDPKAARPAAQAALRLLAVADEVAAAYQEEKRELAALDFDDLLIAARDLLAGPHGGELRKRLAAHTKLLLVDEFQDTDPLQAELVKSLCDGRFADGKLFFVGDRKQSIYRFRGADPSVFEQLRGQIADAGRLSLTLNFRSQPAVLDFVNALFCEELGPDYEPLRASHPQVAPRPAVEFLWATVAEDQQATDAGEESDSNTENNATESPADADMTSPRERLRRREADWIARRLRAMLDSGEKIVWDKEAAKAGQPAARPVRPGDIALLFRALTNVDCYEEALRRHGIDYYLVGGHAFYAQQEIYDVINLLRTLANTSDEVSLIGVLRSPMFALLDETLFWLSRHPGGVSGGLFAKSPPAQVSKEQSRRVRFAAATLKELRAVKDRVPIAQLIGEALARTGYDAVVLAEFLGQRKLANLRKLIDQARSFDQSGIFTLADFITQLSQFVVRQPDEPLAATHAESVDVVRLMTIHQAKGLEFPVVVIPDLDRQRRGPVGKVAFTRELGPMINDSSFTAANGYDFFCLHENDEEQLELARLLYVATTRAADYLILSSGLAKLGEAKSPWSELVNRHFPPSELLQSDGEMSATTNLRSVPGSSSSAGNTAGQASSGTHLVKVTSSEPPLPAKPAETTPRHDLKRLLKKAQEMAAEGDGLLPKHLGAVPPDPTDRRQYSFSRLTGILHARNAPTHSPAADGEETAGPPSLDPRGLGTLVHAVLADIDMSRPEQVAELVHRHAARHLPDEGQLLAEPIELIERLMASPRGAAMAAAVEVHRELEFLLAWPLGCKDPESFCLQGYIDCLYRDAANRWRLIDYKTNRVEASQIAAVAADYEMQMLVYALAVERILGQPPAELTLCFLRPGLEHSITWNDAARQRAAQMVSAAIDQASQMVPSPAGRGLG